MGKFVVWRPAMREPFPFEERRITKADWDASGVVDQDPVVWNQANNWMVPRDQFNDAAWPYVLGDSGFVIEDHTETLEPSGDTSDPDSDARGSGDVSGG